MAVITPSALISEIRGSVGMQTFSKNRYGPYVKAKLVRIDPNTLPQQNVRAAQAAAVAEWQGLTQAVMDKWMNYANDNVISGRISRKFVRAGYNEYISRCMNRYAVGGAGSGFEPLPKVRLFPIITGLTQGSSNITVHFDTMKPIGNCDLVVYATPPISPGINEINPSYFRIIGIITPAAQISSANIYSAYTALYPLAAPDIGKKIGIALKAVNTDNFAAGRFFFIQTIISASLIPSVIPSIVQQTNTSVPVSSGTFTVELPIAPAANSIHYIVCGRSNGCNVTPPAGWNLVQNFPTGFGATVAFYKVITVTDPATWSFIVIGTANVNLAQYEIDNVNQTSPLATSGGIQLGSSNNFTPDTPPFAIPEKSVVIFSASCNPGRRITNIQPNGYTFDDPARRGLTTAKKIYGSGAGLSFTPIVTLDASTNVGCIMACFVGP